MKGYIDNQFGEAIRDSESNLSHGLSYKDYKPQSQDYSFDVPAIENKDNGFSEEYAKIYDFETKTWLKKI